MDFGDIIILLLFLAPVLRRLLGSKQPKPRPAPPTETVTDRQLEDPLADALRQIREALGDEGMREEPQEEALEVYRPRVRSDDGTGVRAPRADEFREVGEFEHEAHGFGRENPLSEEVFERRPAFVTPPHTEQIRIATPPPVDLTEPLEVDTPDDGGGTALQDILSDPQRARDAFILHEVFDAPRSHKPWRRR